jgi:hypothetical protein
VHQNWYRISFTSIHIHQLQSYIDLIYPSKYKEKANQSVPQLLEKMDILLKLNADGKRTTQLDDICTSRLDDINLTIVNFPLRIIQI